MGFAIPIILAATAIAGTATAVYGTMQQKEAANKQNEYNQQVLTQEKQAAALQKQQADLESQRRTMEIVRNNNRARAIALSNSVTGGAQYGSGLQGGYGQISGEANTQLLGVSQNQELANSLYGVNSGISNTRFAQYGASSQFYSGSALTSLGGEMIQSMGAFGRLAGIGSGGNLPHYTPQNSNYYVTG